MVAIEAECAQGASASAYHVRILSLIDGIELIMNRSNSLRLLYHLELSRSEDGPDDLKDDSPTGYGMRLLLRPVMRRSGSTMEDLGSYIHDWIRVDINASLCHGNSYESKIQQVCLL